MWNTPATSRLANIPKLYETENISVQDKLVHLHFFLGGCDWYVIEYDGDDLFWGFVVLNNDMQMAEWGYFTFSELQATRISGLEVDCELKQFWEIRPAHQVDKICQAQGWSQPAPPAKPYVMAAG